MKGSLTDYNKEFKELTEDISEAIYQMSDPVAIATMLYSIAEEKKSSNLVVRDINSKFDHMMKSTGVEMPPVPVSINYSGTTC